MKNEEMIKTEKVPVATTPSGLRYVSTVDIRENDEEYTVYAEMPGVHPSAAEVELEEGILTLRGRMAEAQGEGRTCLWSEFETGSYERSFSVGEGVDAARISAVHTDGILTLHLPKSDASKPRRIEVKERT